jgi:hypothetical protein
LTASRLALRAPALVGLTGSALSADRHADSACEGSIFLDAKTFRPAARGVPSSGTLESCAHSRSGVCALPTRVENPATVIAKKARAVIFDTRICASSRDGCCYRYLLDRCRGRQITHQYWHFLTASSRSPRGRTLTMLVVDGLHHQYFRDRGSPRSLIE